MQSPDQDDAPDDFEEETLEPGRFRFQFGISTLLYIMTGLAVLCGTIAWLGVVPVLMIVSIAGGTFGGLFLCNFFGLGFGFEELSWDIAKCFIIAAIAIIPGSILVHLRFQYFPLNACFILSALAYCFSVKIAWLDIENPEVLICSLSALVTMVIILSLCAPLLRA